MTESDLEEKEQRKHQALEEHARLHRLYRENRFAFERERKRMIHDLIGRVEDAEQKKRLWEFQATWEKRMRGAGSDHNRLVLAQCFFWEHVHEKWLPAIQGLDRLLNGRHDKKKT